MSEETRLLRFLVPADKEFKVTAVTVTGTATKFTSQLAEGFKRKLLRVFNHSLSGEMYWGGSTVTAATGMPIPSGEVVDIPVQTDEDVYFVAPSGHNGNLRVLEIA